MEVLETIKLTKTFGSKTVVNELSLTINSGEIFALLGPNGSGKSTLVKTLVGMIKPTSGDAFLAGKSILSETDDIKRIIGVLPESLGLFQSLTIWEHLILAGEIYGVSSDETAYRAEQLLRSLDLWELRQTKTLDSSYGMKKKCSLAMALIHRPQIVFLDEPFEGIDPISARSIKNLFARLKKGGSTIFITSHITDVIEKLADSFAIISDGRILCQMQMQQLREENSTLEEIYFAHINQTLSGDLAWLEQ